jgi:hypothetical protein
LNAFARQCLAALLAHANEGDRITIIFAALHESAFGPKQARTSAPQMSAFYGKADIAQTSQNVR